MRRDACLDSGFFDEGLLRPRRNGAAPRNYGVILEQSAGSMRLYAVVSRSGVGRRATTLRKESTKWTSSICFGPGPCGRDDGAVRLSSCRHFPRGAKRPVSLLGDSSSTFVVGLGW